MHTTPLSTLFPLTTIFTQMTLSSSSLSIHSTLTQAFLTFKTLFSIISLSLLGWLHANLLLLTPLRPNSCSSDSKTNSPKYTSSLTPPTLLEILALFDEHLTFSDQVTSLFKACYYHIHGHFTVSGLTSIPQLSVPLLPLSFTPNLITSIFSTIDFLSLNYPVSSRSRTVLLVFSLKLLSPAISLPPYALSTGSESMNAWNTNSSHSPTTFLQLPNLHTS